MLAVPGDSDISRLERPCGALHVREEIERGEESSGDGRVIVECCPAGRSMEAAVGSRCRSDIHGLSPT